ncbi:MAG: hypothetical protein WAV50_01115 [Minisyncoccia bacterium]
MIPAFAQRILFITVCVVVLAGSSFAAYQIGYKKWATDTNAVSDTAQSGGTSSFVQTRFAVLGTVAATSTEGIVLKDVRKTGRSANQASLSGDIVVAVNPTTVFERLVQKNVPQGAQSTTLIAPPPPPTREKIALKDLKIGDTVLASVIEVVSTTTIFMATKIEVQERQTTATAL